eukprot:2623139-Pyramimonas_sp.AAC.1
MPSPATVTISRSRRRYSPRCAPAANCVRHTALPSFTVAGRPDAAAWGARGQGRRAKGRG